MRSISYTVGLPLARGFCAKIFVPRPEGVYIYVERKRTEIENALIITEKFVEFQPQSSVVNIIKCFILSSAFSVAPKYTVNGT